jgi:hypothetical protein
MTSWHQRKVACERAIMDLKRARDQLRDAGATQAANAVARALKSVDGARRHADGRELRDDVGPGNRLAAALGALEAHLVPPWERPRAR